MSVCICNNKYINKNKFIFIFCLLQLANSYISLPHCLVNVIIVMIITIT